MNVYVDPLVLWSHGTGFFKGRPSCHLFAADFSPEAEAALHQLAQAIGMRRAWAQLPPKSSWPHYDLAKTRRQAAIRAGAIELGREAAVALRMAVRRAQRLETRASPATAAA